ncbi:sigma 54-interacting transcriptional regulator [Stigmatella aurantiaca]|nr:sigma 54-interacting transcriptional regulator [Stigmatella aurantiaca]
MSRSSSAQPFPQRLGELEVALLGNPYLPEVRGTWNSLRAEEALPGSVAEWARWWAALSPFAQQDDAVGLILCVGVSRMAPAESRRVHIHEAAQILPVKFREACAELAARCLAVKDALDLIVGDTEMMRRVRQEAWGAAFGQNLALVRGLAPLIQTTPVLIRGETGTGKELVGQALCRSMPGTWRDGTWTPPPSQSVHLAALPDTLVESTLFGHKKGSFTGAGEMKGVFELCHEGVVFLDEVAELPLKTQVSLLRALQEGKVRPLGSKRDAPAAPRVVSATHQPLEDHMRKGRFREDLYHRLSSVIIQLPPLRDRREDIPLIAEAEIEKADASVRPELKDRFTRFIEKKKDYAWPGNVRELSKVVRALALGLEPHAAPHPAGHGGHLPEALSDGTWTIEQVRSWYAAHVRGLSPNLSEAAERLGVDRGTLRKLLKEHEPKS